MNVPAAVIRRWLFLFALLLPVAVEAYESRPAYLKLREVRPGEFSVLWKTPLHGGSRHAITPEFSGQTRVLTPPITRLTNNTAMQMWRLEAADSLRGQTIRIPALESAVTDTLVHIEFAEGNPWIQRLTQQTPEVLIPRRIPEVKIARLYFELGMEQILLGSSHLFFVFALLLLVFRKCALSSAFVAGGEEERVTFLAGPSGGVLLPGYRVFSTTQRVNEMVQSLQWCDVALRLVKIIAAFTVAHSITLALSTLGILEMPAAPVEAIIALSIVFIAAEIVRLRRGCEGLTVRIPWAVAFMLGLLHGVGFAEALSDVGLPQGHLPLAILCFNVGIEAGLLLFILAVSAVILMAGRLRVPFPRWTELAAPYAVGCLATFWFIQRVVAF